MVVAWACGADLRPWKCGAEFRGSRSVPAEDQGLKAKQIYQDMVRAKSSNLIG